MNKFKLFFIWQDDKEEAWLNDLSARGLRLDSVSFPFTYHFSSDALKKYTYHLNTPKGPGTSSESFKETFQKSGWERLGRIAADVRAFAVPCSEIARQLGKVMVKNIVALGALQEVTRLLPDETYLTAIRRALKGKPGLVDINERAFAAGRAAVARSS